MNKQTLNLDIVHPFENIIIIWKDQVTAEMNGNADTDRLLSPGITDVPGVVITDFKTWSEYGKTQASH